MKKHPTAHHSRLSSENIVYHSLTAISENVVAVINHDIQHNPLGYRNPHSKVVLVQLHVLSNIYYYKQKYKIALVDVLRIIYCNSTN